MNVKFEILYKSGLEDTVLQSIKSEESADAILKIMKTIDASFTDDFPAMITLGDGEFNGLRIRLSEVARVKTTIMDMEETK